MKAVRAVLFATAMTGMVPGLSNAQILSQRDCTVTPTISSFDRTTKVALVNLGISTKDRLSTSLRVTVNNASDLDQTKTVETATTLAKNFLEGIKRESFTGEYYSQGFSQYGPQYALPVLNHNQSVASNPINVVVSAVPGTTTNASLLDQLINEAIDQSQRAAHYGCFRDSPS